MKLKHYLTVLIHSLTAFITTVLLFVPCGIPILIIGLIITGKLKFDFHKSHCTIKGVPGGFKFNQWLRKMELKHYQRKFILQEYKEDCNWITFVMPWHIWRVIKREHLKFKI